MNILTNDGYCTTSINVIKIIKYKNIKFRYYVFYNDYNENTIEVGRNVFTIQDFVNNVKKYIEEYLKKIEELNQLFKCEPCDIKIYNFDDDFKFIIYVNKGIKYDVFYGNDTYKIYSGGIYNFYSINDLLKILYYNINGF